MMLILNRHRYGYGQGVYIARRLRSDSQYHCKFATVGAEKHEVLFPTTPDVEIVLAPKVCLLVRRPLRLAGATRYMHQRPTS